MKATRQLFEAPQQKVQICESGRILVAINEEVVKTTESVPSGMDEDGEMRYSEQEKTQYAYDTYWLDNPTKLSDALSVAKQEITAEISAYDSSSAVNSFLLNGMEVWLDKATRVGLMNSTTIAKAMGQANTTLWLENYQLEVDCDKAIQLLSALEMYALDCFNVTAAHKKAVSELTNIEDMLAYDYKAGYPEKLKMEV